MRQMNLFQISIGDYIAIRNIINVACIWRKCIHSYEVAGKTEGLYPVSMPIAI